MNNNVSDFFNIYGYSDNTGYIPRVYEVKVSKDDNVISINKENELVASIKLQVDGNVLSLIGKNDVPFSSIDLPLSSTITNISYDADKQAIIITVHDSNGNDENIEIPLSNILDDYAKKEDVEKNSQAILDEANIRETADQAFAQKDAEIDEKLSKKVEWTELPTEENPNRKSIVLENHDTILGRNTDGGTNNLVMLSKWNKADYGSTEISLNLNGKDIHPTYNDNEEIAFINDINNALGTVRLLKTNDLEYTLYSNNQEVGKIIIPKDQFLKNVEYNTETFILKFTFETSEGENVVDIDMSKLSNIYEAGEGLSLNENTFNIAIDNTLNEKYLQLSENGIAVNGIDNALSEIDEKLSKKVEWTEIPTEEAPNRKSIVLENHDTILGKDTNGAASNLLMLSKWNKVDVGTSKLPINFNTPKDVRPTVQEAGQSGEEAYQIAYTSDLQSGLYNLGEVESFNNLDEAASAKGVCDIQENIILPFKITSSSGKESGFIVNVRYGEKISQALYWKQSLTPEMYRTLTIDAEGNIDNPPFYPYDKGQKLYNDTLPNQSIFTLTTEASDDDIKTALTDVLGDKTPITDKQLDECLKYGYYLLESSMRVPVYVGWNGNSYTLTMVGLANPISNPVIATVSLAINDGVYSITKNGNRSTIITASNIENNASFVNLQTNEQLLLSRIEVLEAKLSELSKTNIEEVTLSADSEDNLNDDSKDYIIAGESTKSMNIVGKSVKMDNVSITNNARTDVKAKDVEIKNTTLSGDFPKDNGNCPFKINDAEYIVIRDMIFDSNNIYNGIEIGLDSTTLPKSVLIENCKFLGHFSNNAILIFGTQDNAVINVNNCYFEEVSNPIRLSNNKNVHCTLNITNCKIDKWDVNTPWQGMIIFQDYTSGDIENANTNNLFAPEKITVNVINTIGPNNKKVTMPSNIADVCGTGNEKQLFYVWDNYRNLVPYEKQKYPSFNII